LSTIEELFRKGILALKGLPHPALEAKVLLLHCLSLQEEEFFTSAGKKVSRNKEKKFLSLLKKRKKGLPLAYLTGKKEFWSLSFLVSPGVFIPRPETELLVEKVLELGSKNKGLIVDLGTGCGNVAISLAKELPQARIIATDVSKKALNLARLNASSHGTRNIEFLRGDLFAPLKKMALEKKCDFIVSNPPYLSESDWEEISPEIKKNEPKEALVAGKTGLEVISRIIEEAPAFLKKSGYLLLEIGDRMESRVKSLFGQNYLSKRVYCDLGGLPRLVVAKTR